MTIVLPAKYVFKFFFREGSMNLVELFWTFAFSVIVVVSVVGNCLVIWIVCGKFITTWFRKMVTTRPVSMANFTRTLSSIN